MIKKTLLACVLASAGVSHAAGGPQARFTLSSPDIPAGARIGDKFVLKGFGCSGENVSPALVWKNAPAGTKSFALQVHDPDAPTGSGFWHWAVYNIPASATELAQGAGNAAASLPSGATAGMNDFHETGVVGGNGNWGGPCPPVGDRPHRYVFTIYALAVDDLYAAAGIPKTGTPALHGFVLNKGLGNKMLGKASFTARYGR